MPWNFHRSSLGRSDRKSAYLRPRSGFVSFHADERWGRQGENPPCRMGAEQRRVAPADIFAAASRKPRGFGDLLILSGPFYAWGQDSGY